MEFRCIREAEVEEWTRLCGAGFNEDPAGFLAHYQRDPYADPTGVFVAVDEGRFVSSVRVFNRQIYIGGVPVTMGGIGEVTTLPEYRGRGLSSELLRMAVAYMTERGLHTSLLFTGVNHHYAHAGWFTVPRRYIRVPLKPWSTDTYTIQPVREEDIPVMAALQRQYAHPLNGAVAREPEYIRRWVNFACYTLVYQGGKAVGCAQMDVRHGRIEMNEYAGEPAAMRAMIAIAAAGTDATFVNMPAVYALPEDGFDYSESLSLMARLNSPFTVGDRVINTTAALAEALSGAVFFSQDGF